MQGCVQLTSIRLYTLCNLHSVLRKAVYNLIEVISNEHSDNYDFVISYRISVSQMVMIMFRLS
jgi:hypothetical protein